MEQLTYRSSRIYDNHDISYTKKLVSAFKELPIELQNIFQNFTNDLMDDHYISSWCLMDAINDFKKKNNNIYKDIQEWKWFDDKAFNYRPWQLI